jgi:ABC-type multidrug transport system ATPase subunit
MDEASMCDRIALIQEGAFMKIDTPQNIVNEFDQELWTVKSTNMSKLLKDLRANPKVKSSFAFGDSHHITVKNLSEEELTDYLVQNGHQEISIAAIKASIEDCFMDLSKVS